MTESQRLPAHQRVADPPGMRLTERDIEVVKAVYSYRFLRRDQIQQLLFPSARTAQRRLVRLYQHRYLQRIFLAEDPTENLRNTQAIYCLDEQGATLLAVELGVPLEEIDWYPHRNDVKDYFLKHTLKINDFRIAITLAAQKQGDEVTDWITESELKALGERVADPNTDKTYPVVPDSAFVYQRADGKKGRYFLEIDMATMANRRFARKIRAYELYRSAGAYTQRYQSKSFRVLTVVPSSRRLRNLKNTTEQAGGGKWFWFTTFEELTPERVLGPVWEVAGRDGQFSLVQGREGRHRP